MENNDQELVQPLVKHQFKTEKLVDWMASLDIETKNMDVLQFQGGMSNPTFLVRLENEKKFVLRKKPPGKLLPKAHAVDREFTVMSALQNTNIPVPKMVGYCGDPEVIGTEFFLMEYIEGRVVTSPAMEDFSATDRRDVYISLAKTMANLHKVEYLSAGLDKFGRPEGYLKRQINLWSNQYKKSRVDIQVSVDYQKMDWLCDWLIERADIEDEVAIAHGDYRLGNTIIHRDKPMVIGVLDWELSTIGHPLADLGYFCIPYRYGLDKQKLKESGIPSEEEFLDLYLRYSNRRDIQTWPTFLAFSLFRSAAIIFGVAARTTLGNVSTASSDINEQVTRAQEMAIIGCEIASKSP
jgi:aminoglycoside phosphotransferase (APT) family kinase protein